jgi:hypothetical protein
MQQNQENIEKTQQNQENINWRQFRNLENMIKTVIKNQECMNHIEELLKERI